MSDDLEFRIKRLEDAMLNNLAGYSNDADEDEREENGLFGFGGGGSKRATGKKLRSYSGEAFHKFDSDLDIYPSTIFEAANKTEALRQLKEYVKDRGDRVADYTFEVELDK